jgi:uncharacterized protein with FMN-binding domain
MASSKKAVVSSGVFLALLLMPVVTDAQTRTRQQVEALIEAEGRKTPGWWTDVKLDYPATLHLDVVDYQPGIPWDNQRYVRAYVREIIKPNPHRWRSGVKLYHLLMIRHKDNVEQRTQAMQRLGFTFYHFEQDFARAAYWWQQAKLSEANPYYYALLADCYWRLGNKPMAMEAVNKMKEHPPVVKLLADMGEITMALQQSENLARTDPVLGYFHAGDTCRTAGRNKEALAYYQKAIAAPYTNQERDEKFQKRAEANALGLKAFELLDLKKIPDGTYQSDSIGFEGPIHIAVTVTSGRITDVKVTNHREKQYFTSITDTCRKIIAAQGVKGIDATTGATVTAEAIINATAKALAEAMKK